MQTLLSEQEIIRREKLVELMQLGIDPYPAFSNREITLSEAINSFSKFEEMISSKTFNSQCKVRFIYY